MAPELSYQDYVCDQSYMDAYSQYQSKYARNMRESDRILINIIERILGDEAPDRKRFSLLDIGCSTGNLLLHLKHALPQLDLSGGDIVASIVAGCRANPDLAGIQFSEMNMLNMNCEKQFDLVVANAAMPFFTQAEFEQALANISAVTKPGGWFVAFDWFHPFEQDMTIIEKSATFPQGLVFHFRSYTTVKAGMAKAGLLSPAFELFYIPIDLEKPGDVSRINSYTVPLADGQRMCFRGSLFQPWCHVVEQKSNFDGS